MSNEEKLAAAKEYLGHKWVLHPLFKASNNPALKCRSSYYMSKIRRIAESHGRM